MEGKCFEAGNIYLATYLVAKGYPMRGISGFGRSKRILFDNTPQIQSDSNKFFRDSEEQRLFNCYRRVKDFLFQNGA